MKKTILVSFLVVMLIPLLALTRYAESNTSMTIKSENYYEKENITSEKLYFANKDIEITVEVADNQLIAVSAPKGVFTKVQLLKVMETVNAQSSINSSAAAPCPCVWWDIPCFARCAICEALGGCDEEIIR